MKTRITPGAVAVDGPGTTRLRALISAETLDRESEVLVATGAELDAYRRNPVLLWGHDASLPPIGRAVELSVEPGVGVWAENEFAPTPFAQEIGELYREGFLHAFSVGFRPLEVTRQPRFEGQLGLTILRWELVEQSAVAVPANPDALAVAAAGGNRAADWLVKTYYAAPDDEALLACLGLPGPEAGWSRVAAASFRFFGARGGLDLSPSERERAERLLRGLYDRCGRRFPEAETPEAPRLATTRFHHDEAECFEAREMAELIALVRGRSLALRNIARKRRRRAQPLPELDPLRDAAAALVELLAPEGAPSPEPAADLAGVRAALLDLREALAGRKGVGG